MSVANLQGLKAQMAVRPTTAKPTYASEEERLAAVHAAQERSRAAIEAHRAKKVTEVVENRYKLPDFSKVDDKLLEKSHFAQTHTLLHIPSGKVYTVDIDETEELIQVLWYDATIVLDSPPGHFIGTLNEETGEWKPKYELAKTSGWEAPHGWVWIDTETNLWYGVKVNKYPTQKVIRLLNPAELGAPLGRVEGGQLKRFTIQETINRRIRERREAALSASAGPPPPEPESAGKDSPEVAADKKTLRIPPSLPFNRENLRVYYRKVALRFHPDKNPGKDTTEMFKQVQAAYERLLLEASE